MPGEKYRILLFTKLSADAGGLIDRLGGAIGYKFNIIDEIQSDLSGHSDNIQGAYVCTYPVFRGIYQLMERLIDRTGQSAYLMLCTVIDGKGNPMKDGPMLEELIHRMGDAVRRSVRRGDAMCQYGKGQVLVLLVNTTRENCEVIQQRINERFIIGRQRIGIRYYVNSVFWTPRFEQTDKSQRQENGHE